MIDGVATIHAARDRTIATGTARITCTTDHTWAWPQMPAQPRRGPVQRAVRGAGKAAGKGLWRVLARGKDFRHQGAEGVIDFAGRRFMIDYGSYAMLQASGQLWSGRSGRALSTLPASAARVGSPLWLLDLLDGLTGASDLGTEEVEGQTWQHWTTTADLAAASAELPDGMATPANDRFEDLLRLPLDVWVDDTHLRRISFTAEHRTETVTFSDFATGVEALDWDRLPTFLSPKAEKKTEERQQP